MSEEMDPLDELLGYPGSRDRSEGLASWCARIGGAWRAERGEYARRVRELESQVARMGLERSRAVDRARAMQSQRDANRREIRELGASLDSALAERSGGDAHESRD